MERVNLTLYDYVFALCYECIRMVQDQLKSFFWQKLKFGSKTNLLDLEAQDSRVSDFQINFWPQITESILYWIEGEETSDT